MQFHSRSIRGRPLGPAWYPGWPLYVCDQRYLPLERAFIRVKNWLPLIPEEVRSHNFMPIQPFDPDGQRVVHPRKMKSPFLKGVRGPGHIGEEGMPSTHIAQAPSSSSALAQAGTSGLTQATDVGSPKTPRQKRHYTKRGTGETAMRKAREAEEAKAAAEATAAALPPALPSQPLRPAYEPPKQVHHHKRKIDDRSVNAAAGGPAYLRDAKIDVLPNETGELFASSFTPMRSLY